MSIDLLCFVIFLRIHFEAFLEVNISAYYFYKKKFTGKTEKV